VSLEKSHCDFDLCWTPKCNFR